MKIDLSSFEKALGSLKTGLDRAQSHREDKELRDAVIQRFEYSYELAWKMIKRQLEKEMPTSSQVDQLSFRDLIREAAERGWISHVDRWMEFRELRNITSHTYDENKASSVYQCALPFYEESKTLLYELQKRNTN